MKKRVAAFILALTLSMGLSGCGYEGWSDTSSSGFDFFGEDYDDTDDSDEDIIDDDSDDGSDTEVIDAGEDSDDDADEVIDDYTPDYWGFTNSYATDSKGKWHFGSTDLPMGYFITSDDYKKIGNAMLYQGLDADYQMMTNASLDENTSIGTSEWIEKHSTTDKYLNYNVNDTAGVYFSRWEGSCYGMVMTAILSNRDVSNGKDYGAKGFLNLFGTEELSKSTKLNKREASAINFYFYQQYLSPYRAARDRMTDMSSDGEKGQIAALKRVATKAEKTQMPFAIGFNWRYMLKEKDDNGNNKYDGSGHEVMGYGIQKKTTYWKKDSLYDNYVSPNEQHHLIQSQTDADGYNTYTYMIKVYDPNCSDLTQDRNIYINPEEGTWCYPYYNIMSKDNTQDGSTYDNNGMLTDILANEKYINSIDYVTGTINSEYKSAYKDSPATIFVSKGTKFTVKSSSGQATIDNGGISDNSYGTDVKVLYSPDDGMSGGDQSLSIYIPQGEKEYSISSDDDLNFDFRVGNLYIQSKAESGGTITLTEKGEVKADYNSDKANGSVTITSDDSDAFGIDDCNTVEVNAPGAKTIDATPGVTGVKIEGDDLSQISVNTVIAGQNTNIDLATDAGSVQVTKDITGDTVIAKADTNGDGTYDRTISKTKIPKKTKQKITLKKKNVSVKAGKTVKLKAKAKTKLTYKKTSGNKKISIFSSGKIKVSKKLKKGTYKIKVKVTAKVSKKYKKTTGTFTVRVKVK